jgi:putative membrane protein
MGHWSGPSESTRKSEAMDILRSRYARGEIDTAEFEERRQKLES